jgi:hypothetical protein
MAENYTITLDDVQAFLDSKRDDETVGVTCDGGKCLAAMAFKAKYPEIDDLIVCWEFIQYLEPHAKIRWHDADMGAGIGDLIADFDNLVEGTDETPITKRQWLDAQKAVRV